MPVLIVHGVEPATSELDLLNLITGFQTAIARIKPLGLKEDQITVWFPKDLYGKDLGEEIIIFVKGLYRKSERTSEVLARLKEAVLNEARISFPSALLIEVFIEPIDQELCLAWPAK